MRDYVGIINFCIIIIIIIIIIITSRLGLVTLCIASRAFYMNDDSLIAQPTTLLQTMCYINTY